ncbi:DNA repair protein RAD50 [Magnaporthiopsis poae ATCC 64411]|uniref:DNA repair protein RAD50 n=1 Tax=Magnaporthiopsis poae (strain ATCC 64411 / 73-15) TaxID=644358 RepID=A0A0C4DT24_MAGP6|nr:DNA repair protein RAD50 [Magnaporthiopsis poae ATCC 64411]
MSRIDQLNIRGIRSFGVGSAENVKFHTPLTLIVGENGCGKTTIIECLKYATTGEQPPNSKGGAFIHDPKIDGESQTKAQVKLQFFSTIGEKLVVTRSMSLTWAKKKATAKTLDGTLKIYNGPDTVSLSKKNADLDRMIPDKMGVPAAILESVIFCHQEDSLWPLSEPSVLKKKFDELFEAVKYTKAIDALKVLRKKHGDDLRLYKTNEVDAKRYKEKGESLEKEIRKLRVELQDLNAQYDATIKEMKAVGKQEKAKREEAQSFLGVVNDLKNKVDLYQTRKQIAEELQESIDRMTEPDEVLEAMLSEYNDRVQQMEQERDDMTAQYNNLHEEIVASRKTLSEKHTERGKHASDQEHHERQLTTRLNMIHEAAQYHEIRGYDGDLTDAKVQGFEARIQKILDDKKREVAELNQAQERLKNRHDSQISELVARREYLATNRADTLKRMKELGERSARLQRDANDLDVDEGARAVLEAQSAQLEERLRGEQEGLKEADLDRQINNETDQLNQLENQAARLNSELVQCSHLASERAQLDLRKKEAKDQSLYLHSVTETWEEKLSSLIGAPLDPATIGASYQDVLDQRHSDVAAKRKLVDSTHQEQKQFDMKLSVARDEERTVSKELEGCEAVVRKALAQVKREDESEVQIESFLATLTATEEDLSTTETDIALFDALLKYYGTADKKLNDDNKCSLCERTFGERDGLAKSKLMRKIAKNLDPAEKNILKEERAVLSKNVAILKNARKSYEAYQRAQEKLPSCQENIKSLESRKDAVVKDLEAHDAALRDAEEKLREAESMGKAVRSITDAQARIRETEKEIERLSSQQSSISAVRSAQEIQDDLVDCSERTRALNNKISKLSADRQRRKDMVSQLELDKSGLQRKMSEFDQKLVRKRDLVAQMETLKEDRTALAERKEEDGRELEQLEPKIAKAKTLREQEVSDGFDKIQAAEAQRSSVASTVDKLKSITVEIEDYVERGGPALLAASERSIKNLEQAMERTEKEVNTLTSKINRLRQELSDSGRKEKNIKDNLSFNKTQRALETLQREIGQLERRNAEEDWSRIDAEANAFKHKHDMLSGKSHGLMGTITTKEEVLLSNEEMYEQDYKDARTRYREAHIKVETTKAAIEDMASYVAALEQAILSFHSLKMEEVNRIAGELWRATYQGTDIDTISIKSEAEGSGTTTATMRRSYNYRLCMVKGDLEMDMRGRCSAGQKVLASIIIRLALAESFGVSCGLVALDEPTTNLDEANIRSLAVSLHSIIQARQAQANFQLIIITHDEAFLRAMQVSDFCDTFYRVRRDEMQRSRIVTENVSMLMT